MSQDRPIKKPDSPRSETTTVIPKMADDLTKSEVASNLDMESQTQLAMVSQASHTLFQKQTAANRLLFLVANYKLTKAEFKKQKENTLAPESKEESLIKNPILLAISALLEKDLSLALTKGSITDPSGRTRYDSPLEYAYWSANFFVCNMILEKVKGKPDQEKKAFAQIRAMQDKATNYDVVLMPTLTATQTANDILLGFKAIILVSTNTLISSDYTIPDDAILLQEKHEGIIAYKMANNEIKFDKSFDLNKAVKKIQDTSIQDILSCFPKETPSVITQDNNAALFEKLCLLCGYSMPTKPTLIKYFNAEDDPKMSLWGDLNGRWQLTKLDDEDQALFSHVPFPLSGSVLLSKIEITLDMSAALKKYHTVSQYDLSEFTRKVGEFLQKYPVNQLVPASQWDACEADALKLIGMTQKYFPAWIAQLWCSDTPFSPLPNFTNLIASINLVALKLYGGRDFYDSKLGNDFSIYKASLAPACALFVPCRWGARPGAASLDLAAMAAVCELMKVEFGNINQKCLAFENPPEISSKANRSRKP